MDLILKILNQWIFQIVDQVEEHLYILGNITINGKGVLKLDIIFYIFFPKTKIIGSNNVPSKTDNTPIIKK